MAPKKLITFRKLLPPAEAALIAGVCPMTITRWATRYGIGWKRAGRWQINASLLEALLKEPEIIEVVDGE